MPEQFSGLVEIQDAAATTTISLQGNTGDAAIGGGGEHGDLRIRLSDGKDRIRLNAQDGSIAVHDSAGNEKIRLISTGSTLTLRDTAGDERIGIVGQSGTLTFKNADGTPTLRLNGALGDLTAGGGGVHGDISVANGDGQSKVRLASNPPKIELVGGAGNTANLILDAEKGDLFLGGHGTNGNLVLHPSTVESVGSSAGASLHLDAGNSRISVRSSEAKSRILLDGASADVLAGGNGVNGDLKLFRAGDDHQGKPSIHLEAGGGNVWLGGNGVGGDLVILPFGATGTGSTLEASIQLDGDSGDILAGGNGVDGELKLFRAGHDFEDKPTIRLEAGGGNVWLGGNGVGGDLVILPFGATGNGSTLEASIQLDGDSGDILAGGNGVDGELKLFRADHDFEDQPTIHLDAREGNLWLGGNGVDGDLMLFPSSATDTSNPAEANIHLDGNAGDIVLRNADCAEEFDIASMSALDAGTVMVLAAGAALRESTEAYDKKVAGVLSGAGEFRPGIVLDRKGSRENRRPLALMGKVCCKVDADCGPVEIGDLLTTSPTPGHAMKAADPLQAFGAVIGKALRPLQEGKGLIPILVSLQ